MRGNSWLAVSGAFMVGTAIAIQGLVNGALSSRIGVGVFAATAAFSIGLILISVITVSSRTARRGVVTVLGYLFSGLIPFWLFLGGIAGGSVVIAQALTVPVIGVTIFTTSITAGQLVGGLLVDATRIPPGGKKNITARRVVGVLIVMAGVAASAAGSASLGFSWWWPLFPFGVGSLVAVQQAFNGRIKVISGSTLAATFVNFTVGTTFLSLFSLALVSIGYAWTAVPGIHELWMFTGGILGVFVIGMSSFVVQGLGVLTMTIIILLGNMVASVVIDIATGHAQTALSPLTLLSLGLVATGSLVVSTRGLRRNHKPHKGTRTKIEGL